MLGVPFTDGNAVDVLRNGNETFPALEVAIDEAGRSVDLLWFSWGTGAVSNAMAEALARSARRGVRVRVVLDAFGSQRIGKGLIRTLRAAGCQAVFYRPLSTWRPTTPNLRTHRRVLVCDETLAFTGGTCIDQAWAGDGRHPDRWRDTNFRIRGPAVNGLRSAFASAWLQVSGRLRSPVIADEDRFPPLPSRGRTAVQVLRPGSGPGWNDSALVIAALLRAARERVRVATPYARLPLWLRDLVTATSRRGVQVQFLVSGPHVDRPTVHLEAEHGYEPLLEAGVQIWRYQPAKMHTKVITVDRRLAMVGTVNVDLRSLDLNEQVSLVIHDPAVVDVLDGDYDEDLLSSEPVPLPGWRARGLRRRTLESVAALSGRPLAGWGSVGLIGREPW